MTISLNHHALRCFLEQRPHHLIAKAYILPLPIDLDDLIFGAVSPKQCSTDLDFRNELARRRVAR